MSPVARIVIVVVLRSGAALFVSALRVDPQQDAEPVPAGVEHAPAGELVTGPPAEPGVLDDHENCRECHEEIWNEWQADRHSQAWVGELYTELSKNHTDANCWSCHAPRPVLETGLNSPAEARANRREAGITCLSCHKRGDHVVGSHRDPDATPAVAPACGPVYDPAFPSGDNQAGTNVFCSVCHGLHGTIDEFMGSEYARDGKTCLHCHMDEVVAPVAKGGTPRLRRVHRMPGGHSQEMLRRAMTIEPRLEGEELVVRVINQGAGHRVPTDARHRAIYLVASFVDEYDQPVPATGFDGVTERDAKMDLIRLFYRHEQTEPTQIDPAGTLGKENWRESRIAIPIAARGGSVTVRLYYFLRVGSPLHKGTLVEERTVSLDG